MFRQFLLPYDTRTLPYYSDNDHVENDVFYDGVDSDDGHDAMRLMRLIHPRARAAGWWYLHQGRGRWGGPRWQGANDTVCSASQLPGLRAGKTVTVLALLCIC